MKREDAPPVVGYSVVCVECNEQFEPGDPVTWRWRHARPGLIHAGCRREGDNTTLTEPQIRADERTKVAEEIESRYGPFNPIDAEASGMAQSIVWHIRGLCDNCGRAIDAEPCGRAHGFNLTGRLWESKQ